MKNKTTVLLLLFLFPAAAAARLEIIFPQKSISPLPGSTAVITVREKIGPISRKASGYSAAVNLPGNFRCEIDKDGLKITCLHQTTSNELKLTLQKGKEVRPFSIPLQLPASDFDRDGYPDIAELRGSASFREWFCMIAESQFYQAAPHWFDVHKDCGGLVEFAYREALKRHDTAWTRRYKFLSDTSIADDRLFYYPDTPFLGKLIFRVQPGAFNPQTVKRDFSAIASGSKIRLYCSHLIGREISDLKKGDLLFFFHEDNLKMPSHTMIYLGNGESGDPASGFVLYHTGPGDSSKGIIKKARLSDLMQHPDPSWRPCPANPAFLGFFRWNILD